MKLTLSHSDVISGVCAFLATRGLTGFDPSKVHAEFTKSRDGTLSCVLDDEAPVAKAEEVKQVKAEATATVAKETPAAATGASATEGGANAAAQAEPVSEAKSDAPAAQVAAGAGEVAPAAEAAATGGEAVAAAGEENLFG